MVDKLAKEFFGGRGNVGTPDFIPGPNHKRIPLHKEVAEPTWASSLISSQARDVSSLSKLERDCIEIIKELSQDPKNLVKGKVKVKLIRKKLEELGYEEEVVNSFKIKDRDKIYGIMEVIE